MTCTRCGADLDGVGRFCRQCGAEVAPVTPASRPEDDAVLRAVLPVGRTALSIAAGYLGLFAVIPVFAPLALIVGVLALRDLKRKPGALGRGRAIFGVVMGALMSAILLFILVATRLH